MIEAVTSQIWTLTGVLIGALTSYFSVMLTERSKHRREMAIRWDQRKLDTYIEYAACVKEVADFARRSHRVEEGSRAHGELVAAMEASERRRSAQFEGLVLLAAPPVIEAAHEVNLTVRQMLERVRGHEPPRESYGFTGRLNAYHERVREDLGIRTRSWPVI
ncbi:hypothetical protein DC008_25085 [Streptomyces nigra]|nr:hypothetical protein DC008_25085 [Streptomyces nigra]